MEEYLNKIICGDCLEVMKKLPDKCVDLVLTDPPYNVGFKYDAYQDKNDKYAEWCKDWFTECLRVSKNTVCISTGNVNVAMWCKIEEPKWIMCWWKPAAMGRSPIGFCNWEPMLLYGKPHKRNGCDVIRATIKPDKQLEGHPCPKPIDWAKGFIETLSNENDTILDPFLGSGTTAVACKQLNRNFIGIEISPEYCKIAEERLKNLQGDLFNQELSKGNLIIEDNKVRKV